MKTVTLKSGKQAIPLIIRTFISKNDLVSIITDIKFHNPEFDFKNANKRDLIKKVKTHIAYQGRTVFSDWYEDTDSQPEINEIYCQVEPYIDRLFPEL